MTGKQEQLLLINSFREAVRSRGIKPATVAGILILVHDGSAANALAALPVWFPDDLMMRAFMQCVRTEIRKVLDSLADETMPLKFRAVALRVVNGGKR